MKIHVATVLQRVVVDTRVFSWLRRFDICKETVRSVFLSALWLEIKGEIVRCFSFFFF